ncbi:hypothetical protein SLS53_009114 [Cytospora paraplurivora]|uniref:ATP-dependent (S)-NAD(P)H-hydrate dehydratase n=1 Tax=Cytospora paraplurivora TaxID=2898453 RepID=A0AAN9TYV7_9PEZI
MSPATKELLGRVRQLVPPMLDSFHKGQLGRIAVIGGSEDYTGAPYFSAMASARLGCDLSHLICTPGAASVIKTYSPNIMVHPLMRQSPSPTSSDQSASSETADSIASRIIDMLPRLHVIVIGPGLGRDPLMQDTVAKVITAARKQNTPLVLDADALQVVQKSPEIIKGYKLAVLTPNVVEFGRLCKSLGVEEEVQKAVDSAGGDESKKETAKVEALARALGGVTIVQKGFKDFISDGETTLAVDLVGGKKRSGGQGDTLTGSIATFLGWRKAYLDGLWDHGGKLPEEELVQLAAFGGASITRESSRLAFNKRGRSLQASDLTDEVHTAFLNIFGEEDPDAGGQKL